MRSEHRVIRWPAIAVIVALVASSCSSGDDGGTARPTASRDVAGIGATRPLILADPADTPLVDTSRAAVPLEEVVFDTFDGRSVGLDDVDQTTIDRLFDAIQPLDAPEYESSEAANRWLAAGDIVVGYVDDDSASWAYPTRIMDLHEIVNDELAGRPILVSWCPLCGSGVVYDREVAGSVRSFSNTSALHENDLVMVDRESGTYWWQVAGRGIVGPDTAAELEARPSVTTSWGRWRAEHPDTTVLARPRGGGDYGASRFAGYDERVDAGDTPFPVSGEVLADDRLSPAARVIVVHGEGSATAFPVEPARTVEAEVDGRLIRVVTDGIGGVVTDAVTGQQVPTRTSMWFAVVAAFPEVVVEPVAPG